MATRILVGTKNGLWQAREMPLEPVNEFTALMVTALAQRGDKAWAIADGRIVAQRNGGRWMDRASLVNQGNRRRRPPSDRASRPRPHRARRGRRWVWCQPRRRRLLAVITDGMDASYARAIAVAEDTVLISTSTGPRGHRAALYRKLLDSDMPFVRCSEGLPWFDSNIDTGCLAAQGSSVVFGTDDGRVFRSLDGGAHWFLLREGLPRITAVSAAP